MNIRRAASATKSIMVLNQFVMTELLENGRGDS
jgi:hypothetical protein